MPIDLRFIATTQKNLLQLAAKGEFRHDLLFHLGAFEIKLPPLRERADDIGELANYFIEAAAAKTQKSVPQLTTQALAELEHRPWHGNVRELRSAIEHALIMARGPVILPEHFPPSMSADAATEPESDIDGSVSGAVRRWAERSLADTALAGRVYDELLDAIEPALLEVALDRHHGQCAAAARSLGIHRTTLRKKLTHHGLGNDMAADD